MSKSILLLDTGPLVALLQRNDQRHAEAKWLFAKLKPPFLTCEAVISEACYLMAKLGHEGPGDVVALVRDGFCRVDPVLSDHADSLATIMKKYQDVPVSLADACLIRLAEVHRQPCIITFDSDFSVYRWDKKKKFELLSHGFKPPHHQRPPRR